MFDTLHTVRQALYCGADSQIKAEVMPVSNQTYRDEDIGTVTWPTRLISSAHPAQQAAPLTVLSPPAHCVEYLCLEYVCVWGVGGGGCLTICG